jgi:hypothetical protein
MIVSAGFYRSWQNCRGFLEILDGIWHHYWWWSNVEEKQVGKLVLYYLCNHSNQSFSSFTIQDECQMFSEFSFRSGSDSAGCRLVPPSPIGQHSFSEWLRPVVLLPKLSAVRHWRCAHRVKYSCSTKLGAGLLPNPSKGAPGLPTVTDDVEEDPGVDLQVRDAIEDDHGLSVPLPSSAR